MKKFLSLLLTLCLLLGILPSQALAYVGDILPSTGSTVTTETRADGTLVLQNDYIRVTLNKHDGSLTTSPAATADSANSIDRQKPYCEFIIYGSYGYGKAHPATLRLKSAEFVDTTPNGTAKAIKAVYDLTVNLSGKSVAATTAVYYELVQLKENETSADTWGVLTSIDNIKINNNRDDLFGSLTGDMGVIWGYDLDKNTTSIDMALTVGGTETAESENLSANETYKVGVRAYKTVEGGKYYSTETESPEELLPEYTPLDMMLSVNGTTCTADEHGVYRA